MNKRRLVLCLALACLIMPVFSGCSDDEPGPVDPDPDLDPYIWPGEPDELMTNFSRSYEEMNINEYENVVHPDFKFVFIDYAAVWNRQQDIESTGNMFAGNPGVNPDDTYREPVQSIDIDTLIRQTPWVDVPANDPDFPDSQQALYQVRIVFTLEGGDNTMTVDSDQLFFVKSEEIDQGDGTTRTRYFLFGQRDLAAPYGKGNEDNTWGSVKAMYR